MGLLQNYLRTALRGLRRSAGFAAVNTVGLAVGIACCLLTFLYVRQEASYDRFHPEADRLYRLVTEDRDGNRGAGTQGPMGPAMARDFPAVEGFVRFFRDGGLVKADGAADAFRETRFYFADSTAFTLMGYALREGDPEEVLAKPFQVVLTESTAARYFPDGGAVGKTVLLHGQIPFRVSGIAADPPANTHLKFDFVASFSSLRQLMGDGIEGWYWNPFYTYLRLAPGATPAELEGQFHAFVARYAGPNVADYLGLRLQPVPDIHFGRDYVNEPEPGGDRRLLVVFVSIAALIFTMAAVNYTNMATARHLHRGKEIAVRKVVGASRGDLAGQFLAESALFAGAALVLAAGLVALALPRLNEATGLALRADWTADPALAGVAVALAAAIALVSGAYPAFFLSALPALRTLRGRAAGRGAAPLRRGLVLLQFTVSAGLIVGTVVVLRQLEFIRGRGDGAGWERVIRVRVQDAPVQQRLDVLVERLEAVPGVESVARANALPGAGDPGIWPIRREGAESTISVRTLLADPTVVRTLGLEVAEGRDLSDGRPTDRTGAFLVNEALAAQLRNELGWETPVGRRIEWLYSSGGYQLDEEKAGEIVGVVRDFHFAAVQEEIGPMAIHVMDGMTSVLAVRAAPGEVEAVRTALDGVWAELFPGVPMEAATVAADFGELHRASGRMGAVFGALAGVAIVIAALGLLGLSAYVTERRGREIAIRKVTGASVTDLVLLLGRGQAALVAAGILLALPLAVLGMRRWLETFAYRVEIGAGTLALGAGLTLTVALATVAVQTARAARRNPVDTLRIE